MAENQFLSTRYTSWCPAPRSADTAEEPCSTARGFDPLIFEDGDEGDMSYSYEANVAEYVESLAVAAHENQWTELEASCEILDQAGVAIEEICLTHGMPSALISVSSIPEVDETSEQFHDVPAACASSNASTPRHDNSPGLFSPVVSKFSRTSPASGAGVPVIRTTRFGGGMKHSASVPALDSLASNGSSSDLVPNQVYYVSNQSLHSIPATVNDGNHRTSCMKHSVSVPALNHLAIHEHLPSVGQLIQPVTSNRRLISQPSNVSLQSNDSNGYFAADCGDDRDLTTLRRVPSAALSACDFGSSRYSSRVPSRVHSVADLQAATFATAASPIPAGLAKTRSFSQESRAHTPSTGGERQGNQFRAGGLAVGVGSVDCKEAEVAALCQGNITSVASSSRSNQGNISRNGSSGSGGGGGGGAGTRKVGAVRSMKKLLASLFETERKMSVKVWTGGNPNAIDLHGSPINMATQGYGAPAIVRAGYRESVPARNMPKELMRHLEMPVAQ
ncbi:unnamed protein product [Closterium sp. Yama58-4]|nr:unnamed protein product [Closterium sp. Yama58-4]